MFVSWAETKSICNASSLRTVAVFSSKLLHPSLDLCMASIFVNNIIQYIWQTTCPHSIWTYDFGGYLIWERRSHTRALLKIPLMSGFVFNSRSCNGSRRSPISSFPSATGNSASNLVNNTTTGTNEITSSKDNDEGSHGAHHFQGHILQRTFPRTVGSLDQAYPSEYNTYTTEHIQVSQCTVTQLRRYHIAWRRFVRKVVFARSAMNVFILRNSSSLPASKPCESWKTNLSLLWKISSFSMSCTPR